jgi:hypothetical protein
VDNVDEPGLPLMGDDGTGCVHARETTLSIKGHMHTCTHAHMHTCTHAYTRFRRVDIAIPSILIHKDDGAKIVKVT